MAVARITYLLLLLFTRAALAQVTCTVSSKINCFADFTDGKTRLFSSDMEISGKSTTRSSCAAACFSARMPLAGVEFGGECHCGTGFNPDVVKTPLDSTKCNMKCTGGQGSCGGSDAIDILNFTCTGTPLSNYKGCTTPLAKSLPYCDTSRSIDERVTWLMNNLTLDEKIAMISPQPQLGEACGDHTAGKASIGLDNYFWLTETNTNVAARCYVEPWRCPTTFIGPMGMGASFNRTLWRLKGTILGTELRAFNNLGWHRGNINDKIGLTGFGPNINIARDPRFGRTSELPGEDPYLNGHYASEMVQGMQTADKNGHPLMLAYLKHFTAYSTEHNRGHDSYKISQYDLFDSYLPQYEIAFKQGHASGVMCSYDAENGHPSCANGFILNEVIRKKWGQTHAYVTTDCGAVSNMRGPPVNAPGDAEAAAWTLMNGTDLEMGSTVWTSHMKDAVARGLATEEAVTRAAARGMRQLFLAGRFDPPSQVGWSSLGPESINSTLAQQTSREAGLQGMVLLKNTNGMLPLKRGDNIAVVGPMAVTTDLMSDYAGGTGESGCWPNSDESCIVTIGAAIAAANTNGHTTVQQGVEVNSNKRDGIAPALAAAKAADVVVLVLGNDRSQEHEGIDRPDINLPGLQEYLATQVLALGKPTLLILSNGGGIAIDNLIAGPHAIVESFNPAQQTPALAALLFGDANRWGRLPVTIYPHAYTSEKSMTDYDMSSGPGRTYKYFPGAATKLRPLFPFGFGLSYTTFSLSCQIKHDGSYTATCQAKNTGERDGDAVVLVYHSAGAAIRTAAVGKHPVPRKSLVDFSRVRVAHGATATLSFQMSQDTFALVDETGARVVSKGSRSLIFDLGDGTQPVEISVTI